MFPPLIMKCNFDFNSLRPRWASFLLFPCTKNRDIQSQSLNKLRVRMPLTTLPVHLQVYNPRRPQLQGQLRRQVPTLLSTTPQTVIEKFKSVSFQSHRQCVVWLSQVQNSTYKEDMTRVVSMESVSELFMPT